MKKQRILSLALAAIMTLTSLPMAVSAAKTQPSQVDLIGNAVPTYSGTHQSIEKPSGKLVVDVNNSGYNLGFNLGDLDAGTYTVKSKLRRLDGCSAPKNPDVDAAYADQEYITFRFDTKFSSENGASGTLSMDAHDFGAANQNRIPGWHHDKYGGSAPKHRDFYSLFGTDWQTLEGTITVPDGVEGDYLLYFTKDKSDINTYPTCYTFAFEIDSLEVLNSSEQSVKSFTFDDPDTYSEGITATKCEASLNYTPVCDSVDYSEVVGSVVPTAVVKLTPKKALEEGIYTISADVFSDLEEGAEAWFEVTFSDGTDTYKLGSDALAIGVDSRILSYSFTTPDGMTIETIKLVSTGELGSELRFINLALTKQPATDISVLGVADNNLLAGATRITNAGASAVDTNVTYEISFDAWYDVAEATALGATFDKTRGIRIGMGTESGRLTPDSGNQMGGKWSAGPITPIEPADWGYTSDNKGRDAQGNSGVVQTIGGVTMPEVWNNGIRLDDGAVDGGIKGKSFVGSFTLDAASGMPISIYFKKALNYVDNLAVPVYVDNVVIKNAETGAVVLSLSDFTPEELAKYDNASITLIAGVNSIDRENGYIKIGDRTAPKDTFDLLKITVNPAYAGGNIIPGVPSVETGKDDVASIEWQTEDLELTKGEYEFSIDVAAAADVTTTDGEAPTAWIDVTLDDGTVIRSSRNEEDTFNIPTLNVTDYSEYANLTFRFKVPTDKSIASIKVATNIEGTFYFMNESLIGRIADNARPSFAAVIKGLLIIENQGKIMEERLSNRLHIEATDFNETSSIDIKIDENLTKGVQYYISFDIAVDKGMSGVNEPAKDGNYKECKPYENNYFNFRFKANKDFTTNAAHGGNYVSPVDTVPTGVTTPVSGWYMNKWQKMPFYAVYSKGTYQTLTGTFTLTEDTNELVLSITKDGSWYPDFAIDIDNIVISTKLISDPEFNLDTDMIASYKFEDGLVPEFVIANAKATAKGNAERIDGYNAAAAANGWATNEVVTTPVITITNEGPKGAN